MGFYWAYTLCIMAGRPRVELAMAHPTGCGYETDGTMPVLDMFEGREVVLYAPGSFSKEMG